MTDTIVPTGSLDDVVSTAVANAVLATDGRPVGSHGTLVLHPNTWVPTIIDERASEDRPRFREGAQSFSRWESLAAYVDRYRTAATVAYLREPPTGARSLVENFALASFVLDDHEPLDPDREVFALVGRQKHRAGLTLRPTAAALRWGRVLAGIWIDQEELLDLVTDGITEIAEPPAADLRDLVSDLKAVRSTEARSVIGAGGNTAIEMAENVKLHGGVGNTITLPERLTIVLQPWTAVGDGFVLGVVMKAKVSSGNRITFQFRAPDLDAHLVEVVGNIAALLAEATGIAPLWTL